MEHLDTLITDFLTRLDAYVADPAQAESLHACINARRAMVASLAELPKSAGDDVLVSRLREVLSRVAASGLWDLQVGEAELAAQAALKHKTVSGLFAAMIQVPAYQWSEAPEFDEVPYSLWKEYAEYVFYSPGGFTAPGQARAFAVNALQWLNRLCRLAEANRGSAAVKSALQGFLSKTNCIPLYFTADDVRTHFEVRARILAIANGVPRQEYPLAMPATGRRLKIGFLNRHFSPQTETYTTLPSFEQLDPERFEVRLYAIRRLDSALEDYIAGKGNGIILLPEELQQQLDFLRAENLDVLVFGSNITAVFHEVTRLALFRIAPLQVVNNSSCTTTGFPEIDLYVSGLLTEAEHAESQYAERLGLLPGPAHAFNYQADAEPATCLFKRSDLNVPEDAVLFVSASNYYKIIPEMMECWAELMAKVPGSYLLVHPFNPNWSSEYPIKRFARQFEDILTAKGVDHARLLISTARFKSRSDVAALLSVGDLYLDTYPFGGVNSIIDPLEKGIAVVEWEGKAFRSRMGAAILRQLGLTECIATDRASYIELCVSLATDPARRAALKTRILEEMDRLPLFFDTLAASDAFGELMKLAYREICAKGPKVFRSERSPLLVNQANAKPKSEIPEGFLTGISLGNAELDELSLILGEHPNDAVARSRMSTYLAGQGRHERAAEYLLCSVQRGGSDIAVWRDLSVQLRKAGNLDGAKQALETAIRMDPRNVDSWLMLGELAWDCQHVEIHADVSSILKELAPDNPAVRDFLARGIPGASFAGV